MRNSRRRSLAFSTSLGASKHNIKQIGQNFFSSGRCYLFVYNLFMFCGFLYALIVMSLKYSADQEGFPAECWETVGNIFKFLHLLMFLEVHISCKHISYNTTSKVHSLCQVLNPLFGYTKGSVVEAAIQVSKEELYFFHVHSLLDSGDWKKHLDFCLDRQRAEDADKTCRFLPFHDLFCDRDIQVTSINFSLKTEDYQVPLLFRYPYYLLSINGHSFGLLTWFR